MKKKKLRLVRKPTDLDLARYLELTEEISALEAEKRVTRDMIALHGSCATRRFVASVDAVEQERMVGVEEATKIMPRAELQHLGLLQKNSSIRVTVKAKGRDRSMG